VPEAGANGRLVSLTQKEWVVAKVQRAAVRAAGADWSVRVGAKRFKALCGVLGELMVAIPDR
jgi:hypothetical protein